MLKILVPFLGRMTRLPGEGPGGAGAFSVFPILIIIILVKILKILHLDCALLKFLIFDQIAAGIDNFFWL